MTATPSRVLPIGINIDGVLEHDGRPALSIAERFEWVAQSGAFDYIEKNLMAGEDPAPYLALSEQHGVPIDVLGGIFTVGGDEQRACDGIRLAGQIDARLFNCQLFARAADGHAIDDDEVADFFLRLLDAGAAGDVKPSLEVHVDMWSERFDRIESVAERLARSNTPLRITLDTSHLIYKIGNEVETGVSGLSGSAAQRLHPDVPDAYLRQWLDEGWAVHAHARAAVPNGPVNAAMPRPDGRPGRAIQYPLAEPPAGAFHSEWNAQRLAAWQQSMQMILQAIAADPARDLQRVSCEFIPFADYGGGARYSIFDNNVACAHWLRAQWQGLPANA